MFTTFFHELKAAKLPVTLKEYLLLMEALKADLAEQRVEHFYYLSRATLVKDEKHLDKFDQVFGHVFKGLELMSDAAEVEIPEEWLRAVNSLYLSDEEKAKIEAMGGWDKIMEELKKRLEEQKGRHQGGKKWIGTGGTSPYGAEGYNPAGVRIGQKENKNFRAVKVWDKREFKDLDDNVELGTRNIKVALRRLRKFAREGAAEELDLDGAQWNIPAERMKTGEPHLVPLATQAVAILRELQHLTGAGRYLFPGARTNGRPLSDNAINAALRRMGFEKGEMTGHGFRAMARTILDEVLHVRPDYIEHQLAHAVKDPNGRAYNRTAHLPARRKMMQDWANYLDALATTNVVPIRAAKR